MRSKELEDILKHDTNILGDHGTTSEETLTVVTPEMVDAAKLVLSSSDQKTKSLEHSIGEIYVAMASEDHIAINEQKNIAQLKSSKRINKWLYFGASAMLVLAIVLLTIKVIMLF